jgi:F-type H+-transporting ATPase subunit delta
MRITKQARRDAKSLFRACQVNGVLDHARVRESVTSVLDLKPRGYHGLLQHFHRLIKLEIERRTARVESAEPLPPGIRESIQTNLDRLYGSGLDLQFTINPALIGGLRVRVGSDVYEGSIQGRLAALQERF